MKLRSPFTELLFNLSPSTNVTESLKTFGVAEDCTSAIAIRIVNETSSDPCAFETDLKTGLICEISHFTTDNLTKLCDWAAVKQLYKPTVSESENHSRFVGEIVSLIATKNV